jgi:transketolase
MPDPELVKRLEGRTTALRRHLLTMAANGQLIHIGGSMSMAEMMAALFFHYLDVEGKKGPKDHFILSKGHTVHAFHACLAEMGKIEASEFTGLARMGSRLAGHPSLKAPLVEFATGSLGHGLSVGIGIALAEKLNGSASKTVVLMGDGEIQEGSVWEAALSAPKFGLENLLAIVDSNGFQANAPVGEILPVEPLEDKWRSFAWNTHVIDGHEMGSILGALEEFPAKKGPTVIISNTVKGKGVPGVEGTARAHFTTLEEHEVQEALKGLEEESC